MEALWQRCDFVMLRSAPMGRLEAGAEVKSGPEELAAFRSKMDARSRQHGADEFGRHRYSWPMSSCQTLGFTRM